jgi:hypothetical protein
VVELLAAGMKTVDSTAVCPDPDFVIFVLIDA